jgi:Bardet-Biedl syndrome 5 protein
MQLVCKRLSVTCCCPLCRSESEQDEKPRPAHQDGLTAYYASNTDTDGEPVFDEYLGLTVESMPPEVTIQTLWAVI